jgi:hypothetical protein
MNQYLLSEQLAQTLINYLAQKPFQEVYDLLVALQKLQPATPSVETKPAAESTVKGKWLNQ